MIMKDKLKSVFFYLFVIGGSLYVGYYVMIVFFIARFSVPSDSMVSAIMPGSRVLVNKMAYGARLFDVTDTIRHGDIVRLWGYSKPQRNDIVVFNFPYPKGWRTIRFDVMKYYVKRIGALPGDTFEIVGGYNKVRGFEGCIGSERGQEAVAYMTRKADMARDNMIEMRSFPRDKELGWTIRDMGPIYVPCKGDTVELTRVNKLLYGRLIEWELGGAEKVDTAMKSYTFKENYYFVLGDNAPNSQDSRYWGLVPEEFIVGRVVMSWREN